MWSWFYLALGVPVSALAAIVAFLMWSDAQMPHPLAIGVTAVMAVLIVVVASVVVGSIRDTRKEAR